MKNFLLFLFLAPVLSFANPVINNCGTIVSSGMITSTAYPGTANFYEFQLANLVTISTDSGTQVIKLVKE